MLIKSMTSSTAKSYGAVRVGDTEIEHYESSGVLVLPKLFTKSQLTAVLDEIFSVEMADSPERIVEKGGEPNSVYLTPKYHLLHDLVRCTSLVRIATKLLRDGVYIHQAKLNSKVAFRGAFVDWHRDFSYWHSLDGMPLPNATTAAILVDPVDEFNAPLLVVPGSHRFDTKVHDEESVDGPVGHSVGSWTNVSVLGMSTVVGDLKYTVPDADVIEPLMPIKGQPGTTVFFHSNLVHGSVQNMSPRGRRMIFVTFNAVSNALREVKSPRPWYIANRDFTVLNPGS